MSAPLVQARFAPRMLRILGRLQSGGGLNASELALQLDVCRRTVFRDLSAMREAGIQLFFDEEMDCYRLSPRQDLLIAPILEPDELTTLMTAVHLSVLRDLPGCRDLLRRTTTKLLAQSPCHVRHSVSRLIRSCDMQAPDGGCLSETTHAVCHIFQAIRSRRQLRVVIEEPGGGDTIETQLAPYQMVATSDAWMVTGRSSRHRGVRTFDPRDFRSADVTDEIYAIPRRFRADRQAPLEPTTDAAEWVV